MTEPEAGFLQRWAKLKQSPAVDPPASDAEDRQQTPLSTAPVAVAESGALGAGSEGEPPALTDLDMPSIDSLTEESDFSQFLSQGVSDQLRRKALRKLFALPEFNLRDGLNDYDDDFSEFIPLGDTVTYQMKKWLRQQAEQAAESVTATEAGNPPAGAERRPLASHDSASPAEDDDLGDADG